MHEMLVDKTVRDAAGRQARERATQQFGIDALTRSYNQLFQLCLPLGTA